MSVATAEPVLGVAETDPGRGRGGMPARRAVVRWAWRMFRREWKQQALVLALLVLAVAASVGIATAAFNVAPVAGNADFGTATATIDLHGLSPSALATTLDSAASLFGTVEPIGHRPLPFPGSTEQFDLRVQQPDGPYSGPMLSLRGGRYPVADDEVAITDGVADTFGVGLGDVLQLDRKPRTVVGLVENPSNFADEFVLAPPALLASSETVTVLTDAPIDQLRELRVPGANGLRIGSRGDVAENVVAAIGVFAITAVALLLIALIAAASFVVIAHRRMRQLGVIAAMGASERHVRLVMVANGAVLGAVAAVLGGVLGIVGWFVAEPRLAVALGFRLDVWNVPWWLVLTGMGLAILASTGAAWWPARAVSRMPTVLALSGRPAPVPRVRRSVLVAGGCVLAGVACLLSAGDLNGEQSVQWGSVVLVLSGTLLTIIGVLMASPLAVRLLARCATRLPLAPRLALRDLGRYQARSGAALAAISLSLGMPMAVIVVASAAEHGAAAGNLSDQQLIVTADVIDGPFVSSKFDVQTVRSGVDAIAAAIGTPRVIEVDAVMDPDMPIEQVDVQPTLSIGVRDGDGWRGSLLAVATPELLAEYGVDLTASPDVAFWTTATGEVALLGSKDPARGGVSPEPLQDPQRLDAGYSSVPGAFVSTDEIARRGWKVVPSGQWMVLADQPITAAQLTAARTTAASVGLSVEARDRQTGLRTVRDAATAIGMLLALTVLAMTVGLIRNEAAGDLRTLTATGATGGARRMLTAVTAASLAALGVVLGVAGAYVVLLPGPTQHVAELHSVPVRELVRISIGTPVIAFAAGWLFAGRTPQAIARQPSN